MFLEAAVADINCKNICRSANAMRENTYMYSVSSIAECCKTKHMNGVLVQGVDAPYTLSSSRIFSIDENSPDTCSGSPHNDAGASWNSRFKDAIKYLLLTGTAWVRASLYARNSSTAHN